MSTLAVDTILDSNNGTTTSINGTTPNAYNTVGKNLIINGAMQIAQRGTSSTSTGYTTVDRWTSFLSNSTLSVTVSQSTDAPDGFSNSFKWETTAGATLNTNTILGVQQYIEAQTLQQLGYGTTFAKKLTLSFWVKSSVTGTFAVSFYEDDDNRIIGSTYTINTANTWEKKSITIDGDTIGVIDNDNGRGIKPIFHIGAGSDFTSTDNTSWGAYSGGKWAYGHVTNTLATSTGTWQLTGVQLEVGESATEFEHRPYTTEELLCFRYFYKHATGFVTWIYPIANTTNTQYRRAAIFYKTRMRAQPTCTTVLNSGNTPGHQFQTTDSVTITRDNAAASDIDYPTSFQADAEL
jgi:hypothetical protein